MAVQLEPKSSGTPYFWKEQSIRWSQKAPYVAPLPMLTRVTWDTGGSAAFSNVSRPSPDPATVSKAYARLVDSSHEQTQWFVNFHEREQAISQIVTAAGTLLKAFRLVKRGQFSLAAKQLAVPLESGKYHHSKNVANAWLSLHFGWVPLVQDIHSALEILDRPPKDMKIKGSAKSALTTWGSLDMYGSGIKNSSTFQCRMGARQIITDARLAQMSSLGLVNPASVAWELVPYSFVVDWFSNVGQVLSSYTDFVGIELVDSYTTLYQDYRREYWSMWRCIYTRRDILVERSLGITKPRLYLHAEWPSPVRALTAISLLVQHLRG